MRPFRGDVVSAGSWYERRDVQTSRLTDSEGGKHRRGVERWLTVTAFQCTDAACACGGYEVFFRAHEKWDGGSSMARPVWPVIGCGSQAEAQGVARALLRLGKPLNRADADATAHAVEEWAVANGYAATNHIFYRKGAADDIERGEHRNEEKK